MISRLIRLFDGYTTLEYRLFPVYSLNSDRLAQFGTKQPTQYENMEMIRKDHFQRHSITNFQLYFTGTLLLKEIFALLVSTFMT